MKIGVLSDCRVPTQPTGGHGLGRVAYDLAWGLFQAGHDVTLYAGHSSQFPGALTQHQDEDQRAYELEPKHDAWIDLSHHHTASRLHPHWPIINWILDSECPYTPPRCAVATPTDQRESYPGAAILTMGVDVSDIPFYPKPQRYLAFAHKIKPDKGIEAALQIHQRQSTPVYFAGEMMANVTLPNWRDTLHGRDFFDFVGSATGFLCLGLFGIGGGRGVLEAQACGTPALAFDTVCTADHLQDGVSGYLIESVDEAIEVIPFLSFMDRGKVREWVADTHDTKHMIRDALELCRRAVDGEVW